MEKMTKKDMFARVIDVVREANVADADVLIEGLEHEIELVSKKRNSMTKTQKENEELVEIVFDAIKNAEKAVTATEVYEIVRDNDKFTSAQKVSALITKLKKAGRIVRTVDKKQAYFSIAE